LEMFQPTKLNTEEIGDSTNIAKFQTINNSWKDNFIHIHPIRNIFMADNPKQPLEALKWVFWRLSRNASHKEHMNFCETFFTIQGDYSKASFKLSNSMRQHKMGWLSSVHGILVLEETIKLSEEEQSKLQLFLKKYGLEQQFQQEQFLSVRSETVAKCWNQHYDCVSEGMHWVICYGKYIVVTEESTNKKTFSKESKFKVFSDLLTYKEIIPESVAEKYLFYTDISTQDIMPEKPPTKETKETVTTVQQTSKQIAKPSHIVQRTHISNRIRLGENSPFDK